MFKPNFRYTNKIVRNLTLIAEARVVILNAPLIPKWEVSLRRDALIRNAHSSTAIEGNPLSLEDVSALAAGRDLMVRRKDKQEVLNYLEALNKIPEFAKRTPFKSEDLLEMYKMVTKEALENPNDEGAFRNRQVFVGNGITGEVVFMPPKTEEVPQLINDFLGWFNSEEINEIDPVIQGGIIHYEMVRIHPFIDGNGRTARIMATLVFYKKGFDVKRFFALDDYYDQDRRNYYTALKNIDQKTLDLTGWLEYFMDGVAVSIESVKKKVIGLSKDIKVLKEKGQIALTQRQMKIVEWMLQNEKITSEDIQKMFGITRQGTHKIVKELIELDVIKVKGVGKATYYVLK